MSIPMLSSLAVRRFRSFPQDVVKFANPTFLVGQNGSGKSNFVDVFAFLAEAMAAPLQTVFDRRGGFAAVGNRSSARGRPSNLGLKATLRNLSGEANHGQYAFELRALKNYGFEVVREQCVITKVDGSRNWFDREGSAFRSDAESLEPAAETNALALPLIGGDVRFRPVLRFLANMQTCRIEPAVLREMQEPDGGARLRADGGFMQVVVTTHSPDVLDADWIADQHLRVVSWERGASRVAPVSEAVRAAVRDHLMGAGELLRSNALTSEELFEPRPEQGQGELFATDLR